jgi:hypothetical protein
MVDWNTLAFSPPTRFLPSRNGHACKLEVILQPLSFVRIAIHRVIGGGQMVVWESKSDRWGGGTYGMQSAVEPIICIFVKLNLFLRSQTTNFSIGKTFKKIAGYGHKRGVSAIGGEGWQASSNFWTPLHRPALLHFRGACGAAACRPGRLPRNVS